MTTLAPPSRASARLVADGVTLSYGAAPVVDRVSLRVPDHATTVIVGPNGCGKSTLLRGMARLLRPAGGAVTLDGQAIHTRRTKQVARTLGLLPQSPAVPDAITVTDLVGRGRQPHRGRLSRWSAVDDRAVAEALALTGTLDLAGRVVNELSGGQRQRVWIAMALAQQTDLLLLDEPTTYLDLAYQVELLDLLRDLQSSRNTTIVMVLHDLNLAARYADHLVAMREGTLVAEGRPADVITEECVRDVFGLECRILSDPICGTPLVVPMGRHRGAQTVPSKS